MLVVITSLASVLNLLFRVVVRESDGGLVTWESTFELELQRK